MGKTYKDRKVVVVEEKGYTPKILKEEYKRKRLDLRNIQNDFDEDSDERAE